MSSYDHMPDTGPSVLIEALLNTHFAERPAVQAGALLLSYAQLRAQIASTAARLRAEGVAPGNRVLVLCSNGIEHIVAVLAVVACGAIAIPLDPASGSRRLDDAMRQTRPRSCLATEDAPVPAGIQTLRLRIDPVSASSIPTTADVTSTPTTPLPDQAAFIRFTSGSTGQAKGVVLTQAQQLWTARRLGGVFGLDANHRELILVAMAPSGGWQRVAATLYAGGCVIIGEPPLSVSGLLDDIVTTRATGFFTPPPLVRMLLASPADRVRNALQGCRSIEIGSAALPAAELEAFLALVPGARVFVHYGLTECSRAVILDTRAHPERLATVGTPLPGVDISIRDAAGQALPCSQPGEIHLCSPHLASGYWRQPDLDRQRFANGWLATGDYGSLDEEGFVTLLGRRDDRINCGGHCFFPAEAERALGTPAGVEQYLIAGVPDPRGILQEVPWAFVVPADATQWTPRAFLESARSRLPAHMVPRNIVPVPSLPLTVSGKPDRRETVKLYATHTERLPDE